MATKYQKAMLLAVERHLASCTGLTLGELRAMTLSELQDLWAYQGLPQTDLVWLKKSGKEVVVLELG